jgi:hypothetical protein
MRMVAPMRMPMPMNRTFKPGFQSGVMRPGAFDPGFNSMLFRPSFINGRGTFDRFEKRFRFGSFDRFEDRLENRLRFGGFSPRLNSNSIFFDPRLGGMFFMPPFPLGF